MEGNYSQLIDRISRASGVEREELERKIEAKKAKLSGLISKEGAAQIVAAELGVVFDNERLKISEIVHGMKRVNVLGKVTKVFPVREYNKNGREGKIGSFQMGDESSNVRVVLWDTNHISLVENKDIGEGSVVEISNGAARNGELHLSAFSDIKKSSERIEKVCEDMVMSESNFKDASPGKGCKVRAVIVQTFEPKYFKKEGESEQRALLNIVLDDGTETMRAVLFGDNIKKLGLSDEEIFSPEKFNAKKEEIVGDEKFFLGNFRNNDFFNRVEFNVNGVEDVDVNELIKTLEAKVK